MRMLETKRLILKPVEETDLGALLELQWDKDLMQYMNFKPLSFEQQKQWFQSLGKTTLAFSVFLKQKDKNEIIGLGTINHIDQFHQRATWGLKLKSNIQSKGLGFESSLILLHLAFSNLNLQKNYMATNYLITTQPGGCVKKLV